MASIFAQRPNIVLVSVIGLLIIAAAGLSLGYNSVLSGIQQDKADLELSLAETSAELENARQQLAQHQQELNATLSDVATFDALYTNTSTELEDTQQSLERTQTLLTNAQDTIRIRNTEIAELEEDIDTLELNITALEDDITSLNDAIEDLEDDIEDVCDEVAEPSEEVDAICEDY